MQLSGWALAAALPGLQTTHKTHQPQQQQKQQHVELPCSLVAQLLQAVYGRKKDGT
jgi:hypothetical protein